MKSRVTLLMLALGVAFSAVAAPPQPVPKNSSTNTLSATMFVPTKNQSQFFQTKKENPNGKIYRVGNQSSRPWAQIVGWHDGQSQFPTAENQPPQLALLEISW